LLARKCYTSSKSYNPFKHKLEFPEKKKSYNPFKHKLEFPEKKRKKKKKRKRKAKSSSLVSTIVL